MLYLLVDKGSTIEVLETEDGSVDGFEVGVLDGQTIYSRGSPGCPLSGTVYTKK